ncbi:Chromosome partition protein Smc [Burkholderia sp. AD24]|nr:Chromosome partition protein Smc [Burkholderia sp. AD24]
MFSSASCSHVDPRSGHLPPEPHQPEAPRPSAPVAIHVSTEFRYPHAGDSTPQHFLPAAYISHPSGKLRPDLVHPGVRIDEKGRRFVGDGKNTYAIRYDRDHRTERVHQPADPIKPGIPVRLNENGEYQCHGDLGLKGGSPLRQIERRLIDLRRERRDRVAEMQQAERDLDSIAAEIRQRQLPDTTLQHRWDFALRRRDASQRSMDAVDVSMNNVRQEIMTCRQHLQNDLRQQQTLRGEGGRKERNIEFDVNFLQTLINVNSRSTEEQRTNLGKLRDDLGRVQAENRALDDRIRDLNQELTDLNRL